MVSKSPRGVLYRPDLYEEINIKHPYYNQDITKLIACVQECAISSQTGSFIQTSVEDFMLELFYPMTLSTLNWKVAMEYLTPCWYGYLAKFVSSQVLGSRGNFPQLQLLRHSNRSIMVSFFEQDFRKVELLILIYMRMLIKAISLVDIVTSNGLKIAQKAFLLLANNGLREQFEWPNTPPKIYKETSEMLAENHYK